MSRQQTLHSFFKIKSKSPTGDAGGRGGGDNDRGQTNTKPDVLAASSHEVGKKRRSLSIRKTPVKPFKGKERSEDIVFLSDDDNSKLNDSQGSCKSSSSTVLYSLTPTTPQKSPAPNFRSPPSRNKFYSPSKKRSIYRRSPNVKKNLSKELGVQSSQPRSMSVGDETFIKACEGMDDKTIFMLNTINRFLTNGSLKALLDENAQQLLEQCLQVPKPGMRLVCRLYWRQRGWYTFSNLPISDKKTEALGNSLIREVLASLIQNGILVQANVSENSMMTFKELTHILKLEDLKKICKDLLKKNLTSKERIIKELNTFSKTTSNMSSFLRGSSSSNESRLLKIMRNQAGECYKLSELTERTLHKLYLLMFMGIDYGIIRDKKLELMMLQEKNGAEVYPISKSMDIDDASVIFQSKDEFHRYVTAHEINEDFLEKTNTAERCQIIRKVYTLYKDIKQEDWSRYLALQPWLRRFTPANIFIKILDNGIQDLKREKSDANYELALEILSTCIDQNVFRQHKKAEWYAVKVLTLHTLKRYNEAATVLIEGFQANIPDELKHSLRPRAVKIATQKNIAVSEHLKQQLLALVDKYDMLEKNMKAEHIYKQPLERFTPSNRGKLTFGVKDATGFTALNAEQYCIKHYTEITRQFTHGEHSEGRIITALFFLLFWDIIYCQPGNARGIFLSHYQQLPTDMYTECFYTNRKELIDKRLDVIEKSTEQELVDRLFARWETMSEIELSSIVSYDWVIVRCVCACLGGAALAAICRRLAANYSYCRSGFPDLTLWNIHNNKIKFVEVKTDSDKPSMKQIQWMHYLRQHRIDTEFCYIGTNTTRSKARARTQASDDVKDIGEDFTNGSENLKTGTHVELETGLVVEDAASLRDSSSVLDDLDTYNFDSDSDFEVKTVNYKHSNRQNQTQETSDKINVENNNNDKVNVVNDSNIDGEGKGDLNLEEWQENVVNKSDDDVILIPEDVVEIVIDD